MADIATVLKKTIDGLPTVNPDIRQRVYDKARASILGRLEAKEPRPDQALIDKQMASVDRIIAAVESEYAFKDQVEDVLGSDLDAPEPDAAQTPAAPPAPAAVPVSPQTAPAPPRPATLAVDPAAPDFHPRPTHAAGAEKARDPAPAVSGAEAAPRRAPAPRKDRGSALKMIAWAVALVLVLGGGGYAAWVNQDALRGQFDRFMAMTDGLFASAEKTMPEKAADDTAKDSASKPETQAADAQDNGKFTQRLLADGSEVDPGAAGGKPKVGEGTSVAQSSQSGTPAVAGEAAAGSDAASPGVVEKPADGQDTTTAGDKPQTVAVGQRAIFYEEQTSSNQETADQGNVVWTQVEESPGNDAPPEPAIRADVSIPGMDLTLRMTIRRNIDKTLPASHLIELVFVTPEGFPGGAVDDVLRVAFKESEQSAGNPLIGLPVKIDDGLFLYALTDGAAEVETNTTLMRRQSWIDVTILYSTGRRALITMEKGIPGSKVFDDVLKAWSASAPAGG